MNLVIHDKNMQGMRLQYADANANIIYMRFHGPNGDYKGSYTDNILFEYSTCINDWIAEGKEIYTYFNNTIGAALSNLNTLAKYITASKIFPA